MFAIYIQICLLISDYLSQITIDSQANFSSEGNKHVKHSFREAVNHVMPSSLCTASNGNFWSRYLLPNRGLLTSRNCYNVRRFERKRKSKNTPLLKEKKNFLQGVSVSMCVSVCECVHARVIKTVRNYTVTGGGDDIMIILNYIIHYNNLVEWYSRRGRLEGGKNEDRGEGVRKGNKKPNSSTRVWARIKACKR